MAEAVGVFASVVTLSKLIKNSTTIIRSVRNVPKEISELSEEISQLSIELEILHELQNVALVPESAVTKRIWAAQQASLVKARTRIMTVHKALTLIETKSTSVKGKVQWLVMNREETSSLLQNLLQIRMALTSAMSISSSLLQLAFHAEEMRAIRDLGVETTKYIKGKEDGTVGPEVSPSSGTTDQQTLVGSNYIFEDCQNSQILLDLPILGRVTSTMTTMRHHTGIITYAISILLQLPFSRVFIADIFLRRWSFSRVNFRVLRDSTLAVVKLVEQDSDFMCACKRGDTDTMRRMLQQNQATPNEITLDHRTPMWGAVESGKTQAVELLLHYGSDINGLLGLRQTSPLVIAIRLRNVEMVRLLLAHGACDQHVTALGWTPLFYLWSKLSTELPDKPADSVLSVLSTRSGFNLSHSGIIDTKGYGTIHMAAIRGTAADIHTLVKFGVDPFLETGEARWQAIHFAVLEGRWITFEALLSYYKPDELKRTDAQGWTLLHISAASGHLHISQRLLELGVDRHALTAAELVYVPDGLEHLEKEICGRQWTALQLASLYSAHRQSIFMQAVANVLGKDAFQSIEVVEVDEDIEDWVDAQMYIS